MADSPVVERPHTLGRTPDPSVSAALQCHEPGSEAHPTQVPLKSSVDAAGTGASADGPACVLFGISPGEEASGVDSGEEPQRTDLDLSALELLTSVDAAEQEALNENVKPNANVNQGVDLVQAGPCVGSPRRHADAQQEGEEDCAQVPVAAEPADSPTGPVANQSSVSTAGRDGALDAREEGGDISDATETDAAATVTGPEEVEEEAVHLVKNDVNFAVKAAAEALPASQHDVQVWYGFTSDDHVFLDWWSFRFRWDTQASSLSSPVFVSFFPGAAFRGRWDTRRNFQAYDKTQIERAS